ncbi:MAG: hypothetical protein ACOC44_10100 [Promethearchaeia archaeon]
MPILFSASGDNYRDNVYFFCPSAIIPSQKMITSPLWALWTFND